MVYIIFAIAAFILLKNRQPDDGDISDIEVQSVDEVSRQQQDAGIRWARPPWITLDEQPDEKISTLPRQELREVGPMPPSVGFGFGLYDRPI